jgi:hypothetical protein
MNECKTTLKEIHLLYSGKELEAMLQAWSVFPTLKTDKRCERAEKKKLREMRMQRLLKQMV